jgi:hypothetical protein
MRKKLQVKMPHTETIVPDWAALHPEISLWTVLHSFESWGVDNVNCLQPVFSLLGVRINPA